MEKRCKKIIGVSISPIQKIKELTSLIQVTTRMFQLAVNPGELPKCDLFIEPPDLGSYDIMDTKHAKEIYDTGYNYTKSLNITIQAAEYNNNLIVAYGGGITLINLPEGNAFGSNMNVDIGISATSLAIDANTAYVVGYQGGFSCVDASGFEDIEQSRCFKYSDTINRRKHTCFNCAGNNGCLYRGRECGVSHSTKELVNRLIHP